jgi:lipopolysaccharide assembly outer membrane protein LptD (OstA)
MKPFPLGLLALLLAPCLAHAAKPPVNTFLKSDTVRVQRKNGKQIQTWTGNVRYSRGQRHAVADKLVHDEVTGKVTAAGRILGTQLLKGGTRITVAGDLATHNTNERHGRLSNPQNTLRIRHISPTGKELGQGTAEHISWNEKDETLTLKGDVHFDDERGLLRSDVAVLSRPKDRLRLIGGRPVVSTKDRTWSAAVQAEHIDIFQGTADSRRVVGDGKAEGWIHFPGRREAMNKR